MTETAVFGGGCFWCTEAIFRELKGVRTVMPGYAGGSTGSPQAPPTYEQVCSGKTGHAEVVRVEFDPAVISYTELLTVFFATHDPTTRDRQGNDVGDQYRSVIFYATPGQKKEAEKFIRELGGNPAGETGRVVTEVRPLTAFYEAESYHREYYRNNAAAPYCQVVISPKLEKLRKEFERLLSS